MFSRYLILLTVSIWASACNKQNPENSYHLDGFPLGAASHLTQPPKLSGPKAKAIGQSLTKIGQKAFLAPKNPGSKEHPGRVILKKSYVKAISESGGIHRSQGQDLLHKLVAGDYGPCDGVSCAKIFGVDPEEIPLFLDDTFFDVSASASFAKPALESERKVVLSSLAKDSTLSPGPYPSPHDKVAQLFFQKSEPVPFLAVPPSPPVTRSMVERQAGWEFIHALEGFTSSESLSIRVIESYRDDELLRSGWSHYQIQAWRQRSNDIHKGFSKLPPYKGFVYRGLARLPAEQIESWMKKMEQRQPIGLGALDRPALTSASWDPAIAAKFAGFHQWQDFFSFPGYSVLMIIDQRRGLSIDDVSVFKNEREIILPRDAFYFIDSMVPATDAKGRIIMKLREATVGDLKALSQKAS